jgi:hypothetical protein
VPDDPLAGHRRLARPGWLRVAAWAWPGLRDADRFYFRSLDDALWFANRFPRPFVSDGAHLDYLRTGWVLPE